MFEDSLKELDDSFFEACWIIFYLLVEVNGFLLPAELKDYIFDIVLYAVQGVNWKWNYMYLFFYSIALGRLSKWALKFVSPCRNALK